MRLIDANALIEHLARCIEQSKGLMRSVCVAIKCFVEQMPTIEAAPVVHGRWEAIEGIDDLYKCSACGEWQFIPEEHFAYCPYCGERMGKEENR